MELDIESSQVPFQQLLDSQKELFHSQIDQLQKIVVTQCKLTGLNPLSHEMAAGALSIKIGKKPRDLLNAKAVKYMQSIFSIKDNIGKRESREISALCAVTVTQVREFFAGQRSRIRKSVRLSHEKARNVNASHSSDTSSEKQQLLSRLDDEDTLNIDDSPSKMLGPSSSTVGKGLSGRDASIRNFVDYMFDLMKKESTFSGQVKLMEWILKIHNSAALSWFLTQGGMIILGEWLNQASQEEQSTVLLVLLKVLCHLPLHKALPVQISAILQAVNKLRFYRTSDISNRAKFLLTRWSKLFVENKTVKQLSSPTGSTYGQSKKAVDRISGNLDDELSENNHPFLCSEEMGNARESENAEASLQVRSSSSSKKRLGSALLNSGGRRKVLLVEQPNRSTEKNIHAIRMSCPNRSRPITVDDIQKAKMRAIVMQSKHGKTEVPSNDSSQQKMKNLHPPLMSKNPGQLVENFKQRVEDLKSGAIVHSSSCLVSKSDNKFSSETYLQQLSSDNVADVHLNSSSQRAGIISGSFDEGINVPSRFEREKGFTRNTATVWTNVNPNSQLPECLLEKLKMGQILWQTPPEMKIDPLWSVGVGEDSEEVRLQDERTRKVGEIFYDSIQDIPSNPIEPQDVLMDGDDTMTPEIPMEQVPDDADITGTSSGNTPSLDSTVKSIGENDRKPQPDFELLAVLLNNPELVIALTSVQENNFSSSELVKLLDVLKEKDLGLVAAAKNLAECLKDIQKSLTSQNGNPLSPKSSISQPPALDAKASPEISLASTCMLQQKGDPLLLKSSILLSPALDVKASPENPLVSSKHGAVSSSKTSPAANQLLLDDASFQQGQPEIMVQRLQKPGDQYGKHQDVVQCMHQLVQEAEVHHVQLAKRPPRKPSPLQRVEARNGSCLSSLVRHSDAPFSISSSKPASPRGMMPRSLNHILHAPPIPYSRDPQCMQLPLPRRSNLGHNDINFFPRLNYMDGQNNHDLYHGLPRQHSFSHMRDRRQRWELRFHPEILETELHFTDPEWIRSRPEWPRSSRVEQNRVGKWHG